MTVAETKQVKLGTYLFHRLSQIANFKSVFGVPGDFNLPLLEHIYEVPKLNWIGNCNELNAGYSADGYARVNGIGALITTFGVGELSALNAISGAFTEGAGVLHIVGTSSTRLKKNNDLAVHHLIPNKNTWEAGNQNHSVYEDLVAEFSCVVEKLEADHLETAQQQIDNAIEQVYKHSRPGYIFIPVDVPNLTIEIDESKPLNLDMYLGDLNKTDELADKVLNKLYTQEFAVLGDQWFKRRRDQLNDFVQKNELHCFSALLGKSILDESYDKFHGCIAGKLSNPGSWDMLSQFKMVAHFGVCSNELNNFRYARIADIVDEVVEVGKDYVRVDGELYTDVDGEAVFDRMLVKLDSSKIIKKTVQVVSPKALTPSYKKSDNITQASLFHSIQNHLQENDILVSEMCSFLFAIPDLKFPKGVNFVSQNFYGSIGYAVPATLGAALAVKDAGNKRRVILVEGDGSSQMTIQELSSMIKYDVRPTILLLNNEGYSVERIVLGETRSYNDIQPNWNWCGLLKAFGDVDGKSVSTRVDDVQSLETALAQTGKGKLDFIEVGLDKMDVPWRFHYLAGKVK